MPVAHRSRVQGALKVTATGTAGTATAGTAAGTAGGAEWAVDGPLEGMLLAIGAGCGELVHRAGVQQHLAQSERLARELAG